MSEQGKPPIWEEYDDYEERFIEHGGGGGGKKERDLSSLTSKEARKSSRESAKATREAEARQRIFSVLRRFPKPGTDPQEHELLQEYSKWLEGVLPANEDILQDRQLQTEFMRSKTKAGGQNVNKVNSAVRIIHLPTRIATRSDISRDQNQNREDALQKLQAQLKEHVACWKEIINSEDTFDNLHVKYFYLAAHTPSADTK